MMRHNLHWERTGVPGSWNPQHAVVVRWREPHDPPGGESVYTSLSKDRPWTDVEVARLVGGIRADGVPGLSDAAAHGEPEPTGDGVAHHLAMAVSIAAFALAENLRRRALQRSLR